MRNNNNFSVKAPSVATIDSVIDRLNTIEADRQDFIVPDFGMNTMVRGGEIIGVADTSIPFSEWSMSQLSTRIGMPRGYAWNLLQRGDEDAVNLADKNLNYWLDHAKGGALFRTYNGEVDAFLSPRYSRYDGNELLSTLKPVLPDWECLPYAVDHEILHLRLVDRKNPIKIDGEDLFPSMFIVSSDVGRAAIRVEVGIYKKICTNGLCIPKVKGTLFHQRHIGVTEKDIAETVKAASANIPTIISESAKLIEAARGRKVAENEIEDLIKRLKSLPEVSEEDAKAAIELARARYALTAWGITNGLTEVAQKYDHLKRIEMEHSAGRVLMF